MSPRLRIVIAGGGTAGWLAAAVLTRQLGDLLDVTLVESEEIGTVGVGESTIPTVQAFHALIGLDEREFMAATGARFKLGIAFENWGRQGDRYIHSFGDIGRSTWMGDFQHFWLEARAQGIDGAYGDYSLEQRAALAGRFGHDDRHSLAYAYHLDATAYARFLRGLAEPWGVRRVEGRIERVEHVGEGNGDDGGDIAAARFPLYEAVRGPDEVPGPISFRQGEQHVATVAGAAYGMSPYLRLSYATGMEQLAEACARIDRFCRGLS